MCQTTIRKSFRDIQRNEQLRRRFDDACLSLQICLESIWLENVFAVVSEALIDELSHLNDLLSALDKKYDDNLPLRSEEPINMQWDKDCKSIGKYKTKFENHKNDTNATIIERLIQELDFACQKLTKFGSLKDKEFQPTQYLNYFKNELKYYTKGDWNRVERNIKNKLSVAPDHRKKEKRTEALKAALTEMKSFSEFSINDEKTMLFYECLGRHLWNIWHPIDDTEGDEEKRKTEANKLLELAKKIEFYAPDTDLEVVFMDREIMFGEELDCDVDPLIKHNAGIVAMRLGFCNKFFTKGFTQSFVLKLMNDLLKSKHGEFVSGKIREKRSVYKFVYQLAGLFVKKKIFVKCEPEKIINAIKNVDNFGKAKDSTRLEYMTKRFIERNEKEKNKAMQAWIENYIDDYRANFAHAHTHT